MKKNGAYACFSLLVAVATIITQVPVSKPPLPRGRGSDSVATPTKQVSQAARQQVVETYGRLLLTFEANQGQTDRSVQFLSRGNGYTLFLTVNEAVLALHHPSRDSNGATIKPHAEPTPEPLGSTLADSNGPASGAASPVLRMKLVGANPAPEITGLDELPGKSNYFIGNDPTKWRTNVPTYAKVRYENVYSGIDLVYYGNQRQLEYDFVVSPGADPRAIRLAFPSRDSNGAVAPHPSRARQQAVNPNGDRDGPVPLRIDAQGDLVLEAEGSELRLHKPVIYQEIGGARQRIGGNFVILSKNQVGFEVARYDASKPLIIDPVLSYSTYLGGSVYDSGSGIAVDSSGNAYVTGTTQSTNFPRANAFQAANGGSYDAFVTKLNATGSALVYSTYLGGSSAEQGNGIAVDSSGNAYVTGYTQSTNFPTANAFQAAFGGSDDVFVTKLNAAGSALLFSTYLGGSGDDASHGIAVDSSGNAYVTGWTSSTNFPTANAFQAALGGGGDAFVTKLNAAGSALVYSTYLGGSGGDLGRGIAVDSSGNAYVAGVTNSTNFPTANPFQAAYGGVPLDAFVTKFTEATAGAPPLISPGGVVNNASYTQTSSAVAPGSIAAVFGSNLTDGTSCLHAAGCDQTLDSNGRLRTTLSGAQVTVNGTPVPIFYTVAGLVGQLGIQIPTELTGTSATIQITVGGLTSSPMTFPVEPFSPGIFTANNQGTGAGAIVHLDAAGSAVTAQNRARPSELVDIYATGLGQVSPPIATGAIPSGNPTVTTPTVTVDGVAAEVTFSGASGCCAGLYQVRIRIPSNARSGTEVPLVLTMGGKPSNTVTIAVQ